jgi:SAF domain
LIVVGALSAALVVYRTGNRVDVLVAARTIPAGHKVTDADFTTTRVAADGGNIVPASAESNFIGSYATTGVPSGSLINAKMFKAGQILPDDSVVLGLTLSVDQRPARAIQPGDIVKIFYGPKSTSANSTPSSTSSSGLSSGAVIVSAARVVDVATASTSTNGTVTISVLLTSDDASALVPYAASDQVAIGELPSSTHLSIDFVTS